MEWSEPFPRGLVFFKWSLQLFLPMNKPRTIVLLMCCVAKFLRDSGASLCFFPIVVRILVLWYKKYIADRSWWNRTNYSPVRSRLHPVLSALETLSHWWTIAPLMVQKPGQNPRMHKTLEVRIMNSQPLLLGICEKPWFSTGWGEACPQVKRDICG